jgi:hypothetical protein
MRKRLAPALTALAVVIAVRSDPSYGSDTAVSGKKLLIRAVSSGNKLVFKSQTTAVDTATPGGTGDPTCWGAGGGGGAIRVNGGSGNDFTVALPCGGWIASASPEFNDPEYGTDYEYRDPTQATCTVVRMRHGVSLLAICRGPQVAYTLGAPQGNIDVTIRTGSIPQRDCATFGLPPTHIVKDGSRGIYLAKDAPHPDVPCTSSPSGAFLGAATFY